MSFADLGLSEPILRAVRAEGYSTPTPIQAHAIPHLLTGRDLLGSAQTGTGKTAAFALPLIHRLSADGNPPKGQGRRIRVLVLSPTRELAAQIQDSFRTYGRNTPLRYTMICGGVSQIPQVKALRHGVDVLVATPGRLLDLFNQGHVDLKSIEVLVLDEADRMLDMGFLPDVRKIIARVPAQRQTLFFSATMPREIEQLAREILRNPVTVQVAPEKVTTGLISQSVLYVSKENKPRVLATYLTSRLVERAIVFTRTKHGADRVARQLEKVGIQAESLHGDKTQAARSRILANFKGHRIHILVATDLAARGLDVEAISHIVNYDLPYEPETYIHRIGRTGRAGATGVAVAMCDPQERKLLHAIERLTSQKLTVERIKVDGEPLPEFPELDLADANSAAERGSRGPHKASGERSRARPQGGRPAGGRRGFTTQRTATSARRSLPAQGSLPPQGYVRRAQSSENAVTERADTQRAVAQSAATSAGGNSPPANSAAPPKRKSGSRTRKGRRERLALAAARSS